MNYVALAIVFAIALVVCAFTLRRWRTLRNERYGKWRRIGERVVLTGVSVFVLAVFASTAFNAIATEYYWAKHPVPGRIYVVDGHKMHLYCTGAGSPTIILDAGLGNDWTIWGKVQPELSKTTRVCSYDRAGFGWSDATAGPQDANHIADQLHGLLEQAGITGPIVLMGHSISGIYIRTYTSRYPRNVAGLVFVDGSTPLQEDHFPADLQAYMNKTEALAFFAGRVMIPLGALRDTRQCSETQPGFPPAAGKMLAEDTCNLSISAAKEEMDNFRKSGEETVHTGPYGDLPILIFSQDPNRPATQISPQFAKELAVIWNEMQEDLKHLSTRSRRIIARGSSHYVQVDRADLINREVPIFIQQIRGAAPQPTDYGTTKTE
ncbi:MAG: alpha/beta hydrolase [Acidobacteriaceae bacterium]|jgi:pimeloyl-ACP methyl ester carboxylesterase